MHCSERNKIHAGHLNGHFKSSKVIDAVNCCLKKVLLEHTESFNTFKYTTYVHRMQTECEMS